MGKCKEVDDGEGGKGMKERNELGGKKRNAKQRRQEREDDRVKSHRRLTNHLRVFKVLFFQFLLDQVLVYLTSLTIRSRASLFDYIGLILL